MLLGALLLGACGDDGDDGGTGGDAGPSVDLPEPATTSSTAPPSFSGDPDSAFCERLRATDLSDPVGDGSGSPEGVEAELARFIDVLADLVPLAPDEVADDVAALEDGLRRLDAALAGAGYDFEALTVSGGLSDALAVAGDPAFEEAGARLEAYRTQVC